MATTDNASPAIPDDPNEITLRDVLLHMQHHADRLDGRIDKLEKEVASFRQEFREFAKGVDQLDERVQTLEDERIPRIEEHVGLAA